MEITLLCCAMMITGGLIYNSTDAGALLIALGLTIAGARYLARLVFKPKG